MQKHRPENPLAWTLTVRITHWLVALAVVIEMVNETGPSHRMIGYACLLLVLWRIAYGLRASAPASATFYLPSLATMRQHVRALKSGVLPNHVGHNPLGQWAVYLMWTCIGLLAFSGWLSRTDAYWGEDWPVVLHQYLADGLLALVVIHVLAILFMSVFTRKNLLKQMVNGKDSAL